MGRVNKYRYEYVVQGNYGCAHGWDDLTYSESRKEARRDLRDYNENERGVPHRIVTRRIKN